MASVPTETSRYVEEQLVRIRKMQAELDETMIETHKLTQDIKLASRKPSSRARLRWRL